VPLLLFLHHFTQGWCFYSIYIQARGCGYSIYFPRIYLYCYFLHVLMDGSHKTLFCRVLLCIHICKLTRRIYLYNVCDTCMWLERKLCIILKFLYFCGQVSGGLLQILCLPVHWHTYVYVCPFTYIYIHP
jgi:hypothetical protein